MRVPAPTVRGFLPTSVRGPLSAPASIFGPARDTANEDSQHPFQAFRPEPAPLPLLRLAVCSAAPLRRAAKTPAPLAGDARNELVVRGRPLVPRSLLRRPREGSSRPSFYVPGRFRGILFLTFREGPCRFSCRDFRSSLERRVAEQPGRLANFSAQPATFSAPRLPMLAVRLLCSARGPRHLRLSESRGTAFSRGAALGA